MQNRVNTENSSLRSGAVARLVGMPVTTLRVWERRYGLQGAEVLPTGHRRYSLADVERIALLKTLTEQGHAIGSIAALPEAELHALAARAVGPAGAAPAAAGTVAPLRVAVLGAALAERLQRHAVAAGGGTATVVAVVEDTAAWLRQPASGRPAADVLLAAAPQLEAGQVPQWQAAAQACGARGVGVVYAFGAAAARRAHAEAGIALLREPPDDETLRQWVQRLLPARAARTARAAARPAAPAAVAPRRYDDLALTRLAAWRTDIACECPRHVAELLLQLARFEAYSAACEHRSPADAALHADLHRAAATARRLFEGALDRVLQHEGVPVP